MQVADQTAHITHAVLGGMGNISFGISDDPAFFQILSSALYKNPQLAMIRETICNAWDAHIDSQRTDQPLLITIDHEKLVIRDFGKGIPHDLIGPIYGVYGASTKKNDGRQTGGFGLGCKSPFAYTDHFEVISHHDGKRTIYNMSKSSAEKMGKPSIVPIATFPTTESGIQVTINLEHAGDRTLLEEYIRQVVFNGDVVAMLNGELLPVLGLSKAENNFILINDHCSIDLPTHFMSIVSVRYGNVIYPVEHSKDIEPMLSNVENTLQKLYGCRIVFMAPPDSISITPSRESLTMSTLTAETLKTLLSSFLATMMNNRDLGQRHKELVTEYMDSVVEADDDTYTKIDPNSGWKIPGIPATHDKKVLSNTEDFAKLEVLRRYSNRNNALSGAKWLKAISYFLKKMVDKDHFSRGLVSTWIAAANKNKKHLKDPTKLYLAYGEYRSGGEEAAATRWWQKRVMLPLMGELSVALNKSVDGSFYYRSNNMLSEEYKKGGLPKLVRHVILKSHTRNLTHLLTPTIILCHNADRLPGRISYNVTFGSVASFRHGAYFVLEVSRKVDELEKAQAVLTELHKAGRIEFIDMTQRTLAEQREYEMRQHIAQKKREEYLLANPGSPKVPRKAKVGLVRFDQIWDPTDRKIDTKRILDESALRITTPVFIERVSTAEDQRDITHNLNGPVLGASLKLWGSLGAVTNNSGVFDKQRKENNIMSLADFIVDKVATEIVTDPDLVEHMQFDSSKAETYLLRNGNYALARETLQLYKILLDTPDFSSLVPNYKPLSDTSKLKLVVWHEVFTGCSWMLNDAVKAAKTSIENLTLSPTTEVFLDSLLQNSFVGLLDKNNLLKIVRGSSKDPIKMAKLKAIISEIIN